MSDSNHEALREALLNVQRLRQKEQLAREQMETLIQGLQILNESNSVSEMFNEILGSLQRVIPFDCAAILVESSEGCLSTAVSTDVRLKLSSFPITGIFERCLSGKAAAVTRIDKIPEWPGMPEYGNKPLRTALLVALPGLDQPTIIICASGSGSPLKRTDLRMLQTFSPLATQAVQRASELEQLNILINKLDYYAHYDMLTGLPNRTLFDIRLEQELSDTNRKFTVLFLDLDNFKRVNDTYGHNAGDILLGEIAFRLSGVVEKTDTVARMGGDEFAVILRNKQAIPLIYQLCQKIIDKLHQPIYLRKSRIEPKVSIGIAICSDQQQTAQNLMQSADIALYATKKAGRNGYQLFNLQMKARLDRQSLIESRLKSVLSSGELWLAYQMINNTHTHECFCLEVLLRWGPDQTPVYSPAEFIPLAESSGVICDIGVWVLRNALSELSEWLRADSRHTVAINISDVQLHQQSFANDVFDIVEEYDVSPSKIELELSEQIIASNINETVISNLEALEARGFLFSYDDFGVGQSSFLHLQRFPGSRLKIDKTFIDNIESSTEARQLVSGIIQFAHTLKLEVVAEGVETSGQAQILRSINCDFLQGYLLSQPMPLSKCMVALSGYSDDSTDCLGVGVN